MRLALVTTGGTIAGLSQPSAAVGKTESSVGLRYQAGVLEGAQLAQALGLVQQPDAELQVYSPLQLGSQHFQTQHILRIVQCVDSLMQDPTVDGVLITHGTDTLEETSTALALWALQHSSEQFKRLKPLVVTAAMRPADAPQSDAGPNTQAAYDMLVQCVTQHITGVWGLVVNSLFTPLSAVCKRHNSSVQAFDDAQSVVLEATLCAQASASQHFRFQQSVQTAAPLLLQTLKGTPNALQVLLTAMLQPDHSQRLVLAYCHPCVDLQMLFSGLQVSPPEVLVLAAPGSGNVPDVHVQPLQSLMDLGVRVRVSSRTVSAVPPEQGEPQSLDDYRHRVCQHTHLPLFAVAANLRLNQLLLIEQLQIQCHA